MVFDYLAIGQRIRTIRSGKHITQAALADMAKVSPPYLSYIENGLKCMSLETLINIANALEVTADVLLSDCFENHFDVSANELEELLGDCSLYESRILLENAKVLKKVLRDNRHLLITSY